MKGHIVLQGAGKAYRRFASRRDKWLEVLSLGRVVRHRSQWVLRDVDMEVMPGESVGLIGYNGAGKSTLLKLVAGVLSPTAGAVHSQGRVAAILELGVGFHMDLTGRQNIPLAGQLMGYTASELAASADGIAAFAELGDMLDQPLRAYSSGMLARLAFAIATAVRPDILIVDEALSVGDAYFQHKSFERIRQFKEAGTTTLFVSHDFSAVRALCDRVVLFAEGRLLMDGPPEGVLDYYNALIAQKEASSGIAPTAIAQTMVGPDGLPTTRSGSGEATIADVAIRDAHGHPSLKFATGDTAVVDVRVQVHQALESLVVGIMLRDRAGNPIYGTNSWHLRQPLLRLAGHTCAQACFTLPLALGQGSYSLTVALTDRDTHLSRNYDWRDNVLVFEVTNLQHPPFVGVAFLPTSVTVRRMAAGRDSGSNVGPGAVPPESDALAMCERLAGVLDLPAEHRLAVLLGPAEWSVVPPGASAWPGWRLHRQEAVGPAHTVEAALQANGVRGHFGLLAIGLQGNDYWVWQAIQHTTPEVVVMACNGAHPPPSRWVMAEQPGFVWQGDTHYGASPQALVDLAHQKGYALIHCDEQGQHLFFVRSALYSHVAHALGVTDNALGVLFRPPRYGRPEHGWSYPRRDGPSATV